MNTHVVPLLCCPHVMVAVWGQARLASGWPQAGVAQILRDSTSALQAAIHLSALDSDSTSNGTLVHTHTHTHTFTFYIYI